MVPEGWSESQISDLSISVKVGFVGTCQSNYRDFGVPLIRTTNLQGGKLDLNGLIFVTEEFHQKNKKSQLQVNDLLIARHGNHGQAAIVPMDLGEANCLNIVIVRPDDSLVYPPFMLDIFNFDLQRKFASKAAGSTQSVINTKEIAKQKVCVPPLSEQKKIAQILSTWDKAISTTEQLLANSQQQKKALMQQLLTGKKRLSDDKAWQKIPLEQVAEIRTGVAKGKTGLKDPVFVPYLRVANVQDGYINLDEIKKIEIERNKMDRFSLKKGDVLMNEGGDFDKLGRGDVWLGQIDPCLHQNHVFAVRPDPNIMDSSFLAAFAASYYGKTYFLSCAKRSTNLASINSTQLKKFPVLVPSLKEQKKIAAVLTTADQEITTLQQKLDALKQEKKALMQQLLTGKRRVKIEEAA